MDIELPRCHEGWVRPYANKSTTLQEVNPLSSLGRGSHWRTKHFSPRGSSRKRGGDKGT